MPGPVVDLAVTVVVPTARRPESLRRLLSALPAALADRASRVLVVDNDATPTAQAVARGFPCDYLHEPRPGSSFARNRALAETTTEVLAFLDDDVVPSPGWLPALLEGLGGSTVASGGRVVLDPAVPRPRWLDEAGLGGYLSGFDLGGPARPLVEGEYLLTASFAVLREALSAVGGFDPRLGPRPGVQLVADDVHVVRQLRRAGGTVLWQPAAVVTHDLPDERLRRSWLLRRAYLQGRSDWLLDEEELRERWAGGARVAGDWLAAEVRRRRADGLGDPATRFHLAADVVRTAGALRQGLGWRRVHAREPH